MSKEEGDYEEEEKQLPMGTQSRGFSGAPKFSDFRRTVTSTNTTNPATNLSSNTKESKDTKPVTKSRGLGSEDDDDVYFFKKQSNDYYEAREGEVEIAVDDEMKDEHRLLEKVSGKILTVKKEIKDFAHDITHEVKDFYERSIKGERDS